MIIKINIYCKLDGKMSLVEKTVRFWGEKGYEMFVGCYWNFWEGGLDYVV